MKIYASENSNEYDLTPYIGKDLWIMCHGLSSAEWVRILDVKYYPEHSKHAGEVWYYTIDSISSHMLSQLLHPDSWSFYRIVDPQHLPLGDTKHVIKLSVVEPMVVKTTQELFELPDYGVDAESADVADQIAGTNLWVRAENVNNRCEYYLHINKKSGNIIDVDYIDVGLVEFPEDWEVENGPPSESEFYKTEEVTHLDLWDFHKPIDFLTTEEVEKSYHEAEDHFWEEYESGNYWDDEDEE